MEPLRGDGRPDPELIAYYERGREAGRLEADLGALERLRTLDVLGRFLPTAPARVADIGGGPGAYALWLRDLGYDVELIDAVALHVEQAGAAGLHAVRGDARALPWSDSSFDAALLLGPLYHLPERSDRVAALRECRRVLRPGGVLVAAVISRFASLTDVMRSGKLAEPGVWPNIQRDIEEGYHRPATILGFTTSYFHRPDEIAGEMDDAGLAAPTLIALEGMGALIPDLDQWLSDSSRRTVLLDALRYIESEPSLLGAVGHIAAVTRA